MSDLPTIRARVLEALSSIEGKTVGKPLLGVTLLLHYDNDDGLETDGLVFSNGAIWKFVLGAAIGCLSSMVDTVVENQGTIQ